MSGEKISELTELVSVEVSDIFPVVDVSAQETKRISYLNLNFGLRWALVASSLYDTVPNATDQIACPGNANLTGAEPGMPIRYLVGGVWLYGIVLTVASNIITVAGAPITANITELRLGTADRSILVDRVVIPGAFGATTTSLLEDKGIGPLVWQRGRGRLIRILAQQGTDAGTTQAKVNVLIDGSRVLTQDSNNGITLAGEGSYVASSNAEVSATNYIVNFGEEMEVEITSASSGSDPEDLTLILVFIME
jgi:hypothetical protein